jgi:hypothetical protein
VVEGTCLEYRRSRKATVGSNPTLSAYKIKYPWGILFFECGRREEANLFASVGMRKPQRCCNQQIATARGGLRVELSGWRSSNL